MKILYICHRIPYPPNKGDKIRSFNEIKHLSKSHDLHLAFLIDDAADLRHVDALREYCTGLDYEVINPRWQKAKAAPWLLLGKPLSIPYFYSVKLQKSIDRILNDQTFDAVVCFSGPMAEYVFRSKTLGLGHHPSDKKSRPILVMDFCDVDSDKWGQYAASGHGPMKGVYALEQKRLLAYEGRVNEAFHGSVFITEQEARLFRNQYPPAEKLHVIGNGVDFEFFDPRAEACCDETTIFPRSDAPSDGPNLVFTGAMDYHANVDAVRWFCRDIFPRVRSRYESSNFVIVGGRPTDEVRSLGHLDGVKIAGFVDDIRPWYAKADISVIPLRLARGVQNKVLEAMAMGRPVVTTHMAADGIGATAGRHLLVADSAEDFVRCISELWDNAGRRQQLGTEARKFITENFDWQQNMEKLDQLLTGCR